MLVCRLVQLLEDRYPVVEDLSDNENHGEYLEGTASVVMDRIASKLFMTRSPLSSEKMCHELGLHLDRLGVGGEKYVAPWWTDTSYPILQ